jgi:ribose 5-phosphate isomerase B
MTIFIGADHRGFELKNKLMEYLQEKNIRVEDMGAYEYDGEDDNPDFSKKVAQAVLQNPKEFLGIVICGSGAGVSIGANRYKGIYCGLAFDVEQVKSARAHDHLNVLALASDYYDFEKAKAMIDVFIETPLNDKEKYLRRLQKIDSLS